LNLLIAPWGSPWRDPCIPEGDLRWDEVTYVLGNEQVKSRTTLPLLLKTFRPEATLILVCDTVACYSDLQGEVSYPSMVKAVKRKYEGFIDTVLKDAGLTEFKDRITISVIPCFGNFINGEFQTQPADTRLWIFYELLKFLLENTDNEEEVTIALDLTHGINYLPILTYTSLKELLHHLAFGNKIALYVYNSDPFSKGITNRLHVNLIEENIIPPLTEPQGPNGGVKLSLHPCGDTLNDDQRRKLREIGEKFGKLSKDFSQLRHLYESVHAGMPLAALTFMEGLNFQKLLDSIREFFDTHRREGFDVNVLRSPNGKVRIGI